MPGPVSGGGPRPSLGRVLIADDQPESVLLLTTFLEVEGYEVVIARNGQEALHACQQWSPDLVIMDAAMPEMDGFEATREIRRLFPDRWIPIIFLSAYSSDENRKRGLEAGGDDYLAKPVNLSLLKEKLRAMRRIAAMQRELATYAGRLERSLHQAQSDQALAHHLVTHITNPASEDDQTLKRWVRPAAQFSGDVLADARGPGGERYLMMADAAGHGLAAAISVLPLVEAFQQLAQKGFSVASMVSELNRKARRLLPRDRFVAALLAAVDEENHSLQIWNGGLPEALFLDESGRILRSWPSRHVPLGVLAEEMLACLPEAFSWAVPGQLVVYTDGLIEAEDGEGQAFGLPRLRTLLCATPPGERFARVRQAVEAHLGLATVRDDISLAILDCPVGKPVQPAIPPAPAPLPQAVPGSWCMTLRLEAPQIRELDLVPLLMGWLDQLHLDGSYRGAVFTVLSELISNAIDHGLLALDSGIKHTPEGFERYMQLRAERLAHLDAGWIELGLRWHAEAGQCYLDISVADSGRGFAYQDFLQRPDAPNGLPSGRGILIVQAIARQLRYEGAGNRVVARLVCGPSPRP